MKERQEKEDQRERETKKRGGFYWGGNGGSGLRAILYLLWLHHVQVDKMFIYLFIQASWAVLIIIYIHAYVYEFRLFRLVNLEIAYTEFARIARIPMHVRSYTNLLMYTYTREYIFRILLLNYTFYHSFLYTIQTPFGPHYEFCTLLFKRTYQVNLCMIRPAMGSFVTSSVYAP